MMIDCIKCYLKPMQARDIPKVCELLKSDTAKMLNDKFGHDLDETEIHKMLYDCLDIKKHKKQYFLAWTKCFW